ncbi:hypothetical protein GDO86_020650, partial [Hymenochirus boettgeri]
VSLANTMQENPVYWNLAEMKKGMETPPSPTCPPVQMMENWECHIDHFTGRNFYINTETKEKTWKPPRKTRDPERSLPDSLTFNNISLVSVLKGMSTPKTTIEPTTGPTV